MTDILANFYARLLPLFQPRTETYLKRLKPEDLYSTNFRYIFSVQNMNTISHIIEDAVIRSPGVADMHVSFQYFSRFKFQVRRYRRVAEAAHGLWIYGVQDAPMPYLVRTTPVPTDGTPLEKYWFVIAYGPGIYMTLLAEEIFAEGRDRAYEGFYTFQATTAFQVISILHQMFPERVPAPLPPELHIG